jgi:hypothetical protein
VGNTREYREVEDTHYDINNKGKFATGNPSKGKGHDYNRNIPEVHGDVEKGLKWLGTSHR